MKMWAVIVVMMVVAVGCKTSGREPVHNRGYVITETGERIECADFSILGSRFDCVLPDGSERMVRNFREGGRYPR